MRVYLTSLGCRLNQSEIDMLALQFRGAGHQPVGDPGLADIVVVNTCAVTHVAAGKSRQLVRKLHRGSPRAKIVVTGCYAEISPQAIRRIEGVELLVGNEAKDALVELTAGLWSEAPRSHGADPRPQYEPPAGDRRARALVKIQDGCSHGCAYCAVTLARGREWSRPAKQVLSDLRHRVSAGAKEVVLTGVNIGAYGRDDGLDLGQLVRLILDRTDVPRLRLSSIEPWEMEDEWLDLWADRRLCRHLHLPLQSGCNTTLRRMGRRYSSEQYADLIRRARASIPGLAVTTDLIAGLPGETEEDFVCSRAFVQRMAFARLHVFPYSCHPNTPAARFPDHVPLPVVRRRARSLRAIGEQAHRSFHQQFIGATLSVLWEDRQDESGVVTGISDNYLRVYAASGETLANRVVPAQLLHSHADGLWGEIVADAKLDGRPEATSAGDLTPGAVHR